MSNKVLQKEDPNLYIFRYTPLNLSPEIEAIQVQLAAQGLSRKSIYNFKDEGRIINVEYEKLICGTAALQDHIEHGSGPGLRPCPSPASGLVPWSSSSSCSWSWPWPWS